MTARKKPGSSSRRHFLQKLAGLGVMGTVASLRSPGGFASAPATINTGDIRSQLVKRGDAEYENWRQSMMWHLSKPGRYPDGIIQARSEEHIIAILRHARETRQKVALRSSGHNSTGSVLRDEGLLMDLSFLRDVRIDAGQSTAYAQPALWNVQLVQEAAKHGLSFPAAHCPSVALGGYLLGGGLGWNHEHWGGPACHSIKGMRIITANGETLQVSDKAHPDLYWAARGAGPGFFGAVTEFELQLYPAPSTIMGSMYIHPLDELNSVTSELEKLLKLKDERVEILLLFMHNPQAPADWPAEKSKICFLGINAFADSTDEAKQLLEPFAMSRLATTSVFKNEYQPASFQQLYYPENVDTGLGRYSVDSDWVDDLGGALHAIAEHFKTTPSIRTHFVASLAMNTSLHANASFSRIAGHYLASYALWDDENDDAINQLWQDKCHELLKPFSKGHYVNEISGERHPGKYRDCFSADSWQKLQQLRRKYDPDGLFHSYLGHS